MLPSECSMIRSWGTSMLCHSLRGFGRDNRLPVSGSFTIRTLFQTIWPLKMSPVPHLALPLIVDAFHRRHRGGRIFFKLRSCAISECPSRYVCCKNPSDDRSFIFDDFEFAGLAGYRRRRRAPDDWRARPLPEPLAPAQIITPMIGYFTSTEGRLCEGDWQNRRDLRSGR